MLPPIEMPVKELKAFKRILLEANETKTVSFQISPNELYYYDEASTSYQVAPGMYTVQVGPSSDSLPLHGTVELTSSTLYPDLQIANIRTVPAYPLKGEKVQFLATVVNRGTVPTTISQPLEVLFKVNGNAVSKFSEISESLPTGGMKLVNGTIGISGDFSWTANQVSDFTVEAEVNYMGAVPEKNISNNKKSSVFKVYDTPPQNLVLRKNIIASSSEGAGLEGDKAVDGNYGTRWSSQFSDPQWLIIDFGTVQDFNQIKLFWETAFGKEYIIQISDDAIGWMDLVHQTNGAGSIEKWDVQASARYLRIYGTKRGTEWGYSLYEVEVYNLTAVDVKEETRNNLPTDFRLENNYPNPFNPSTIITYAIPLLGGARGGFIYVQLIVYDALGREVATLVNGEKEPGNYEVEFNAEKLSSGVYFYKLQSGNFIKTNKMLLLR